MRFNTSQYFSFKTFYVLKVAVVSLGLGNFQQLVPKSLIPHLPRVEPNNEPVNREVLSHIPDAILCRG
jgi:hypothetical protein